MLPDSEGGGEQTPAAFVQGFLERVSELQAGWVSRGVSELKEVDSLRAEIGKYRAGLTSKAEELPAYDLKRCEQAFKLAEAALDDLSRKLKPKSKLSSRKKAATATNVVEAQRVPEPPMSDDALRPRLDPSQWASLAKRDHEYVAELPRAEGAIVTSLEVADCSSCVIDLSGSAWSALHAARLEKCVVILGEVTGSSLIRDCRSCAFFFSGHQVRIHDTHDVSLYVSVSNGCVVERCHDLRFFSSTPKLVIQSFDTPFAAQRAVSSDYTLQQVATNDPLHEIATSGELRASWHAAVDLLCGADREGATSTSTRDSTTAQ